MRFKLVSLCACILLCTAAFAQHEHSASTKTVCGQSGFGNTHHPVKTSVPEAQRMFDQGLALDYGFNHDEAEKCFQRAAELDPDMAMANWGVALVVGPNYNQPVDAEREKKAYDAIRKARQLAANGPAVERDYIDALARRYTNQPTQDYHPLDAAYNNAMRELVKKYPDDLDAATLFAESGMNLRPWKLWNPDGTPAPGTEEIVATLQSVLRRDPDHLGANHFYIHTVEASNHPDLALPSAQRLAALAPKSGHLVHMPGHIFIRTGLHDLSASTNVDAAAADEAYIAETQVQGIYPMMYYSHNLHFIAYENSMIGRYSDASAGARRSQDHAAPLVRQMPPLDAFNALPTMVLVRFRRWDDIMALPQPDAAFPVSSGLWHYARALAFAARNKVPEAQSELAALNKLAPDIAKVPTGAPGMKNAGLIPQLAAHIVESRIAWAQGSKDAAVQHMRKAVALQDDMDYTEPPDWFYPTRESLGGLLLQAGRAPEAEKVFRDDLQRNPRNPRSLFGLMQALKAQDRQHDAEWVEQQFQVTWKSADTKLRVEDL
jgi:tetratricopeptide (TPR) repeat protein